MRTANGGRAHPRSRVGGFETGGIRRAGSDDPGDAVGEWSGRSSQSAKELKIN
jgi:hypothetical protein